MAVIDHSSASERGRSSQWGPATHQGFSAAVFASVILISGLLAWLGVQGASWAWPAIALPILYTAGALLYRWESKLLIPGWAAEAIEMAAAAWPPIKWLATSHEVQAENEGFVNEFNLTLGEYGLPSLAQGEALARRVRPLTTHALAEKWRKENEDGHSSKAAMVPQADTLVLLHRERAGEVTVNLAQAQKENLIDELTELVERNRARIPDPDAIHPYSEADIRALLGKLRDFDVNFIAEELRAVSRLGARLQRYADFLAEDREEPADPIRDVTVLIEDHGGELPVGPSTLFRLESPAVTLRLMEVTERCDERVLAAVHRGIFLAERDIDAGALRERACTVVAQWREKGDPLRVLQAYLWEKEKRGSEAIAPDQLDSRWRSWSDDAERELEGRATGGFERDRRWLAERLEAGIWPTRRGAEDGGNPYLVAPPVPVPEHEEVRELDAYLITFDERSGSLASVVDGLKSGSGQRQIYRFGPYTRNTRLGVVPRGMPFHEFVEQLLADLDEGLRSYRPDPDGPAAGERALRFVAGRPHSIVLRHHHRCAGPVEFAISKPLQLCPDDGEPAGTAQADPLDGRLGGIEPWMGLDNRRALVRYFPASVEQTRRVCFEYTSRCAGRVESRTVPLLVQPRGQEAQLDQIEVTVNRIDLAHCREARFGDPDLGPLMRSPSIYDVWSTIAPELEEAERPRVKDAFDRVAGAHRG